MKKYTIHPIYPIVIGLGLFIGGIASIRELMNPNIHEFFYSWPRVLPWYLFGYGWYRFLTLNFKVEALDDGYFRLRSLVRTQTIRFKDIYKIDDKYGFIRIFHKGGKTSVTELIDGISNIKSVFPSNAENEHEEKPKDLPLRSWPIIFKVVLASLLLFYAIYVEYIQLSLHGKLEYPTREPTCLAALSGHPQSQYSYN